VGVNVAACVGVAVAVELSTVTVGVDSSTATVGVGVASCEPPVAVGGGAQPSGGNFRMFEFSRPSSLARRQPSPLRSAAAQPVNAPQPAATPPGTPPSHGPHRRVMLLT